MGDLQDSFKDAKALFYPDEPETPIPSSLTNEEITGHYYDPGYGHLHIAEATIAGETRLVANRSEAVFPYEMRFEHVSGNFWLVDVFVTDNNSTGGVWAGEFKVGVSGKAEGLEIQLTIPGEIGEAPVWFKRT